MTDAERAELSRKNLADAWCGFSAMRDTINEHIPLPSSESDLRYGPEMSVSCAIVAECVVREVLSLRAQLAEARK